MGGFPPPQRDGDGGQHGYFPYSLFWPCGTRGSFVISDNLPLMQCRTRSDSEISEGLGRAVVSYSCKVELWMCLLPSFWLLSLPFLPRDPLVHHLLGLAALL